MTSLLKYDAACGVPPAAGFVTSLRSTSVESVMSTKRFFIPSQMLRRGWDFGPDEARIVEARAVSEEDYYAALREVGAVYFIGDELGGDALKIGWSRDPVRRLQEIQTGNPFPLKFIACVAATRMIEPALHQLFAVCHVQGEWFSDPEGSIGKWLEEMTFGQPIARCRWFKAGTQFVNWRWDDKALVHRPEAG